MVFYAVKILDMTTLSQVPKKKKDKYFVKFWKFLDASVIFNEHFFRGEQVFYHSITHVASINDKFLRYKNHW